MSVHPAAFAFTIIGAVLLSLDRLLPKGRLRRVDRRLARFVTRFKPLKGSPYPGALLFVMGVLLVRYASVLKPVLIQGGALGDPETFHFRLAVFVLDHAVWMIPLLWGALWLIQGTILGFVVLFAEIGRQAFSVRGALGAVGLGAMAVLYFTISGVVGFLHAVLLPAMYPLKGVLWMNTKWFNSFSGLVGLVAMLVGTVIQVLV